jgi:LysR family transcriptional regulator, transcriptional activator of nhaA
MNQVWLNYHHLYYFWILAEERSFTRVAEKMRVSQSAISEQIRQLEASLKVQLIDRSNRRRISLTVAGQKVRQYADVIFSAGKELAEWSSKGAQAESEVLRLGVLSGLSRNFQWEFLRPILENRKWQINVTPGDQDRLLRFLKDHTIDLVLTSRLPESDPSLFVHVLRTSPYGAYLARSQIKRRWSWERYFAEYAVYLPGRQMDARSEIDGELGEKKFQLGGEIEDIALLRLLAVNGAGIVVAPEMGVQSELKDGSLVRLKRFPRVVQRFYGLTRQKSFPQKEVSDLIAAMRRSPGG